MGARWTGSMKIRSRSNKADAAPRRRDGLTTKDFWRILGFTPRMCMRLSCARWRNSNLHLGAGAPGASMGIRFTSFRTHLPMRMRFIRGMIEPFFFGYFMGSDGKLVFTCLSHDVVAHETTHALLDGLRKRYMERSTPDQAAFHEGFADVVAV